MPIVQNAVSVPDDYDVDRLKVVEAGDIKIAVTLRLPFRLRFDKLVRFECDVNGGAEVWFRNQIAIKAGTPFEDIYKLCRPPRDNSPRDYWPIRTQAAVILHKPIVSSELLNSLRAEPTAPSLDFPNENLAREVVNRSIIAYSTALEQLFAGRVLRPIDIGEFNDCLVGYIVLVGYAETQFTEEEICRLLAVQADKRMIALREEPQGWNLEDLPDIDVSRIQELLLLHEENLHHELMLTAKNLMVQQQFAVALLVAVAALETVHGAFMRHVLGEVLPDEEGEKNRLINDFMREQGFYAMVRVSPYLFLEPGERPSLEDVERCTKGIEIRNAVMHGLVRKGKFKMRGYSRADYTEGYKGAIALYKSFSVALEKRTRSARQRTN